MIVDQKRKLQKFNHIRMQPAMRSLRYCVVGPYGAYLLGVVSASLPGVFDDGIVQSRAALVVQMFIGAGGGVFARHTQMADLVKCFGGDYWTT